MSRGGWPQDWAERKDGRDCPMCEGPAAGHVDDLRTAFFLPGAKAWLATNSLLPGYTVVAFDGRHVSETFELTRDELSTYWSSVALVSKAIDAVFAPMKINLMALGNWVPHLHTHVVPRYLDDPAPGDPITYADMFSKEPGEPGELDRVAQLLGDELARLRS